MCIRPIGVIYRPPNEPYEHFEEKLTDILQLINRENKKCYLIGDFNIDLFKVNDYVNNFTNLMFSSLFYLIITKPTTVTETATLVDNYNIFVNILDGNFRTGLLLTHLSDHFPVFLLNFKMKAIETGTKEKKKLRIINEKTINNLCEELEKSNFNDICAYRNPDDAYNLFHSKLLKA